MKISNLLLECERLLAIYGDIPVTVMSLDAFSNDEYEETEAFILLGGEEEEKVGSLCLVDRETLLSIADTGGDE